METIEELFKIKLKQEQIECVDLLCSGNNVFCMLPTGYGKSLIYVTALAKIEQVRFKCYLFLCHFIILECRVTGFGLRLRVLIA